MALTLNLGVVDIPYSAGESAPKRVAKARKGRRKKAQRVGAGSNSAKTTGDVATILEAKYAIMARFFEAHQHEIGEMLAEGMADTVTSMMAGAPASMSPYAGAEEKIGELFRDFLDREELAGLGAPGVPTEAAIKGVSHRRLHPYAKNNPRRPSFEDSGLLAASMRAWIEGAA
jgi:hypothetical protein